MANFRERFEEMGKALREERTEEAARQAAAKQEAFEKEQQRLAEDEGKRQKEVLLKQKQTDVDNLLWSSLIYPATVAISQYLNSGKKDQEQRWQADRIDGSVSLLERALLTEYNDGNSYKTWGVERVTRSFKGFLVHKLVYRTPKRGYKKWGIFSKSVSYEQEYHDHLFIGAYPNSKYYAPSADTIVVAYERAAIKLSPPFSSEMEYVFAPTDHRLNSEPKIQMGDELKLINSARLEDLEQIDAVLEGLKDHNSELFASVSSRLTRDIFDFASKNVPNFPSR